MRSLLTALHHITARLLSLPVQPIPVLRIAIPRMPTHTTDDPALTLPAGIRVDRAVQMSRAMVQAANALAACGDDLPEHLNIHATYPDGLSVMLGMSLLAADAEYPDDDDHD